MKDLTPAKETLDPIEIASIDEIRTLQLERMRWSLKHAYENVPMYRQRFDDVGVHPDHLDSLADLAKFPFTHKADLRDNYPFGLFAVPQGKSFGFMRRLARPANPPSSDIPRATSTPGPIWWPGQCGPAAPGRGTLCMSPMAMGCSRGGLGRITAPRNWAVQLYRCQAG